MHQLILQILIILVYTHIMTSADHQLGPDPWHYRHSRDLNSDNTFYKTDIPPDLVLSVNKKDSSSNMCMGELFYRRLLGIILKSGEVLKEDGSVSIKLNMKFNNERWESLLNSLESNTALTDVMFRRSMGYIEESIHKPSFIETIVLNWTESAQYMYIEYKWYIACTLAAGGAFISSFWVWNNISRSHVITILFIIFYFYQAFISYKEIEKKEYDTFISALEKCKWYFWKSTCDVPVPDLLPFIKHMNPMTIAIRMFATIITEPMLAISETVKVILHGLTDDLWFPFDKIVYGVLAVSVNIILVFLLIMITFNYILNTPYSLSITPLLNIGLGHRQRNAARNQNQSELDPNVNRISGPTLDRLLDICSRAVTNTHNSRSNVNHMQLTNSNSNVTVRRSASTGRLPNLALTENELKFERQSHNKYRNSPFRLKRNDGGGDAPHSTSGIDMNFKMN